jgi:hypothetical protein
LAACHWKECQRQSGSAFGMSMLVKKDSLTVAGRTKQFTRIAESEQTDQARSDFYAIESELEIVKAQLALLPTGKELAQTALLATLTGAAIILTGIEALFR